MKIVLFTATGAENLGDELITLCEIREFLKNNEETHITLFSHDIERTKRFLISQKLWLNNINIKEYFPNALRKHPFRNIGLFWETVKAIKKSDHVYIGGGGLLYSKNEEWRSPLRLWWMRVFLAQICRKPITYLSLGISVKPSDLRNVSRMFFWNKTITVRDRESLEVVTELWYKCDILPDPVCTYIPEWVKEFQSRTIGIALRKGFVPDETILQIIKKLTALGYKILLLPHSLHPMDESSHDGYYLQDFLLPGVETTQSIEQTLQGYKKCHIIIAMRLHSMILAIDHHIPFVGMSYSKKTNSLLSEIAWRHAFWVNTASVEVLEETLANIEREYSELRSKLAEIHNTSQTVYHEKFTQIVWK